MHWSDQDQFILHAILASVNDGVIPLISFAKSNHDAWDRLSRLYSKRSNQRIIHLKDKLSMLTCGSSYVIDFLVSIKRIAEELTALDAPPSDVDLLIYNIVALVLPIKNSSQPYELEILWYLSKNSLTKSSIMKPFSFIVKSITHI